MSPFQIEKSNLGSNSSGKIEIEPCPSRRWFVGRKFPTNPTGGFGDGEDSLRHLGRAGDEGVDGVINQDKLGLQKVYVQAKRYGEGNNIGRPAVQTFQGALQGQGASSGILITTSGFTLEAQEYVGRQMATSIVLIDGRELGRLLVQNQVGIAIRRTYDVSEVDENFFAIG